MSILCKYCGEYFDNSNLLAKHVRWFHNKKPCCCLHCHREFLSFSGFLKHLEKCSKKIKNEEIFKLENNNDILCEYGCNKLAKYKLKNDKYCCEPFFQSCEKIKKINSKKHMGLNHPRGFIGKIPWNKGLTKETDFRILSFSNQMKDKYKNHEIISKWNGKKHTDKTKEKMRQKINERYENGWEPICGRCKKYRYSNNVTSIIVDGTWELAYCKFLDSTSLNWERNKKRFDYINLKNKKSKYKPDFYIIDWDIYIEVKGYETDLDRCKWSQFKERLVIIRCEDLQRLNLLNEKGTTQT